MPNDRMIYKAGKLSFLLVCLFLCTACGKEKMVFEAGIQPDFSQEESAKVFTEEVPETEERQEQQSLLVNINTADVEELMLLPGIGERKAAAIIEYREKNMKFENIEDIMNVKGIKTGTFSKINTLICVE